MRLIKEKRFLKTCAGILVAIVLLLNVLTFVLSVVRYYGNGMEPSLHGGQILVVDKLSSVSEGDIIAFYYNNKVLVRRVICGEGKLISIDETGAVFVGEESLEEPYVDVFSRGQCDISFPYNVPLGHVFVMGDNRPIAMDSRLEAIGAIPEDNIIGRVIAVW